MIVLLLCIGALLLEAVHCFAHTLLPSVDPVELLRGEWVTVFALQVGDRGL